jgi:hypothetical protein
MGVDSLFARLVLGDSLGTFRDSVLCQFTGQDQTNRSLNFTRRDGGTLVISSQFGSLGSDTFENVIDKRVHDGHGLVGDTGFGVDLFEDLVNVGRVGLFSRLLLDGFGVFGLLFGGFSGGFTGGLEDCDGEMKRKS